MGVRWRGEGGVKGPGCESVKGCPGGTRHTLGLDRESEAPGKRGKEASRRPYPDRFNEAEDDEDDDDADEEDEEEGDSRGTW